MPDTVAAAADDRGFAMRDFNPRTSTAQPVSIYDDAELELEPQAEAATSAGLSARPWRGSGDGLDSQPAFFQQDRGGLHASEIFGPGTYYMGMIDILQKWDWSKRGERFLKTVFLTKDADGLSAINPTDYRNRFLEAIGRELLRC